MSENDFQKWLDATRQKAIERGDRPGFPNLPSIRVSNDRYARFATLEDRLSAEDRQLLHDMGIAI